MTDKIVSRRFKAEGTTDITDTRRFKAEVTKGIFHIMNYIHFHN